MANNEETAFETPKFFGLTSISGVQGLWMLRVQLLETLDSII